MIEEMVGLNDGEGPVTPGNVALGGQLSGTAANATVATVGATAAATVEAGAAAGTAAKAVTDAATDANTASAVVRRSAAGAIAVGAATMSSLIVGVAGSDPRTAGLAAATGTIVQYGGLLLRKAGTSNYAWHVLGQKYVLPESAAAVTGLLGLTAQAIYVPGRDLNATADLVGSAHLVRGTTSPGAHLQALIEGHSAAWYHHIGAKDAADVLDPGAASFYDATVWTLPGTASAVTPAAVGIASRFESAAFGWGAYWNAGLNVLVKDAGGHSTGALTFAAPTLSPVATLADRRTLFLFQILVDRTNALLHFRLSKAGAAADVKSDVNIAALTDTLTKAAQVDGLGAASGVVVAAAAVAWRMRCSTAGQIEGQGQTLLAAVEAALGFAA